MSPTSAAGPDPVTMAPGAQAALAAEVSADLPAPLSIGEVIEALLEVGTGHFAEVLRAARRQCGDAVSYELTAAGQAAAEQDGEL